MEQGWWMQVGSIQNGCLKSRSPGIRECRMLDFGLVLVAGGERKISVPVLFSGSVIWYITVLEAGEFPVYASVQECPPV